MNAGRVPEGMATWGDLFDAAESYEVDVEAILTALDERRAHRAAGAGGGEADGDDTGDENDG